MWRSKGTESKGENYHWSTTIQPPLTFKTKIGRFKSADTSLTYPFSTLPRVFIWGHESSLTYTYKHLGLHYTVFRPQKEETSPWQGLGQT